MLQNSTVHVLNQVGRKVRTSPRRKRSRKMSSSGGPRAKGGIKDEGKFRQRVEDHYKIMAAAKKTIRNAGVLHNFAHSPCALSRCWPVLRSSKTSRRAMAPPSLLARRCSMTSSQAVAGSPQGASGKEA